MNLLLSTPPWSDAQVENLKKRQLIKQLHPYTCTCGETLTPTTNGWTCPGCDYTQLWDYECDAEGETEQKRIISMKEAREAALVSLKQRKERKRRLLEKIAREDDSFLASQREEEDPFELEEIS